MELLNMLTEFNMVSILFRLVIAMVLGGVIGVERNQRGRAAGLRTYMFVCIGAALAVLLSQYEYGMLTTQWQEMATDLGVRTDISRLGAQVINGIGFLAAGTIMMTGRHQVKGLTTAAGLWASACMGLAVGAGFYACVFWAFLMILFGMHILPYMERRIKEASRNMTICVEINSLVYIDEVLTCIRLNEAHITNLEISHEKADGFFNVIIFMYLAKKTTHETIMTSLSILDNVITVSEM